MEYDQSSHAPFARMQTSRDAPNPLRPYYIPPSIGLTPDPSDAAAGNSTRRPAGSQPGSRDFRALFSDIDYGDYLPDSSPGVADMAKKLMDQAIWNYTSTFMAQPFEVAKIVLQCHLAGSASQGLQGGTQAGSKRYQDGYVDARYEYFDEEESEEEDDEGAPSYFTSVAPHETPSSPHRSSSYRRRARPPSRSHSATPTPANPHASSRLDLRRNDSISEVIGQLWAKESAWGVWKGTNATFVYNVLLKTIETWTRSLLSAIFNLPDPTLISAAAVPVHLGKLNVLDSPHPFASLAIAVASAGIAGLILAPLDMVRTRLILTPITSTPRALIPNLRLLPHFTLPHSILPITLLHSTIPALLSTSFPLFLRSALRVDPALTPTTYSFTTFMFSIGELFVKLPLETVLRRGHVSALQRTADTRRFHEVRSASNGNGALPTSEVGAKVAVGGGEMKTVVPVGPYRGVVGTLWYIVREEGSRVGAVEQVKGKGKGTQRKSGFRRGQGLPGLWRGWRVGFWGLVGVWGVALGSGGVGGEF